MTSHKTPPGLDALLFTQLARREERGLLRALATREAGLVDFSSNDYLSLSRAPDLRRAFLALLGSQQQEGQQGFSLGSGGSRLLDGNCALAEALERQLARFHRAPAGLLFNSGYEANTGLLSAVPQPGDVVVYDELVHASVHAGMRLGRARRTLKFRHNTVWGGRQGRRSRSRLGEEDGDGDGDGDGDLSKGGGGSSSMIHRHEGPPPPLSLEETLRQLVGDEASHDGREIRQGRRHVFVAVEALYSMDGDLAPLQDIVQCMEKHLPLGNGHVVVDEAHSNGVFGPGGRGLVCELGLEKRVWATVMTFGKAMGCSGAIVLCTPITRSYLINYARPFIYTTAMGFPSLASIHVAHSYVASGRADPARRRLSALVRHVRARLSALDARVATTGPSSSSSSSSSPILPVFTSQARSLAAFCRGKGYMVRPIVAPTVPPGTDRVRVCLHAGNTLEECEGLCEAIEAWVRGQLQVEGPPPQRQPQQPSAVVRMPEKAGGHLDRQDTKARL